MKIVTVAYLHGAGGAERQILMLSNALAEMGHEVHLVVLAENKSHYLKNEKLIVHDLSDREKGNFKIVKRWRLFIREIKKISPEITIHYNFQSVYYSMLLKQSKRGKILYSERGDPYDKEYDGLMGLLRSYSFKRTDAFVFQSEGARDYFGEAVRKKSTIIHNPVSIPEGKYEIPIIREKRIVSVGRLHPQKNQKLLIDSFSKICKAFPEYTLEIYGNGKLHDELQKQIDFLQLGNSVKLLDSIPNIFDRIVNASLFVLSSDYEGMPNALLEAMCLGLPCVSTDCRPGGARTLINDGENGRIVPLRDVDALSSCMYELLSNPDEAERLALNAKKIAETHTENIIFKQWESFLMQLLKS